ncbi:trimeric intracellular cation channel family protein [Aurantiacibacter xanthus]|uniref:Trimeric intracellular cation channel family protein n=1 Tax=Aurantiacibacter xanthus TaxID=1784712 RepID=A0A3A1PIS9_9SPHN|nr:trimeric intracellular cation channel family protein [Aurantiacibacter xanthus]RIV93448.1 trimeric intracellular cation channel family protein [Aurantiacibacter xanthus]
MIEPLLPLLTLSGIAVFALSGALLAMQLNQTFVTASFFALLTGVGGGTIRDVMLDAPVFWLNDPLVAPVILLAALVAWVTPVRWWEGQLLEWADAAGLAAFSTLGAGKALAYGVEPVPAMILGVVTGCAGGMLRDMVAGVPSIMMRPDLYVTPSALAAVTAATLMLCGVDETLSLLAGSVVGFGLRGAALIWNLKLPAYSRTSKPDA